MNIDLILAFVFYAVLILFYYKYKDKFQVQNKVFILYKTKIGLKLMDSLAKKFPRLLKALGYLSILVGFAGMILMLGILIKITKDLIFVPGAQPGLAPVLPGVPIPGMPSLSFFHWIISILVVAAVHEFLHGVYARLINVNVKSSGFAFLGPILAAFVEPDDEQLDKKSKKDQLLVYSAGPFANVLLAVLLIFLFGLSIPVIGLTHDVTKYTAIIDIENLANKTVEAELNYLLLDKIDENSPAYESGLKPGDKIIGINGFSISKNTEEFFNVLASIKPGEEIKINTSGKEYQLKTIGNKENSSKGYIGISFKPDMALAPKKSLVEKYGSFTAGIPLWFIMLINWLIVINLGVGLFNLLPLGPVDGGKMFYTSMLALFKNNKERAKKAFLIITIFCAALILINLMPWIEKLLVFLFKPVLMAIL